MPARVSADLIVTQAALGWRTKEVDNGVALSTELSRWPGGRALYDPRPGEPRTSGPGVSCRFYYSGDRP
ncbi:hypothetical protein ACFWJ5_40005 [Streptomyces qaidamensis]|uniref:hypothetical protein n=1 Tax=Streptomyces qaidamensis TaxID=1783515 RepID=UPI00366638CF